MKIRRSLLKDTVTVETYAGEGAYGPLYSARVSVACSIDPTRRLVRNTAGVEVVSEATLSVHRNDASAFTPGSRLTIAGRTSQVLSLSEPTFRGVVVVSKVTCA